MEGDPMNAYRVTGRFRMKDRWMPFTMEVVAGDAPGATEKALSLIGSRHRVKRRDVEVSEVRGITAEEATSPVIQYHLGGEA